MIKLGPGNQFQFNYDYCKGCGLCEAECPAELSKWSLKLLNVERMLFLSAIAPLSCYSRDRLTEMSAFGTQRTSLGHHGMSANDPKRTHVFALQPA